MTQFLGITSSTISAPQQRDGWGLEPAHGTSFFSLECATAFKWVECVQVRQGMEHGNRTSTVRMRPRTWRQGVAAAWWDKFGHVFLDCQLSMDNLQSNKETCQTCSWPWQTLYLCDQAIHHGDAYGLSHAMEKADVYTVVLSIYHIYIYYIISASSYVYTNINFLRQNKSCFKLFPTWLPLCLLLAEDTLHGCVVAGFCLFTLKTIKGKNWRKVF